jgi:hypothetical protein
MQTFYKFLGKEIKYQKSMADKIVEDTIKISFIVKSDGSITSSRVKESSSAEMSKETVRVLSNSTGWIPGTLSVGPVNMRLETPIKFE